MNDEARFDRAKYTSGAILSTYCIHSKIVQHYDSSSLVLRECRVVETSPYAASPADTFSPPQRPGLVHETDTGMVTFVFRHFSL